MKQNKKNATILSLRETGEHNIPGGSSGETNDILYKFNELS